MSRFTRGLSPPLLRAWTVVLNFSCGEPWVLAKARRAALGCYAPHGSAGSCYFLAIFTVPLISTLFPVFYWPSFLLSSSIVSSLHICQEKRIWLGRQRVSGALIKPTLTPSRSVLCYLHLPFSAWSVVADHHAMPCIYWQVAILSHSTFSLLLYIFFISLPCVQD